MALKDSPRGGDLISQERGKLREIEQRLHEVRLALEREPNRDDSELR